MARRKSEPGVKPVEVSDRRGGTRTAWEALADVGDPGEKRQQSRRRFLSQADAVAWRSGIMADRARGTHVAPDKMTVQEGVEQWLRGLRKEQTTIDAYTAALRPVVEALGDKPVQKVSKADIENLVDALIAGTTARGKWASTSINPMLSRLRKVFDDLMGQGVVARNPARLVANVRREDTPDRPLPEYDTFTPEQVKTLMASVVGTEDSVLCIFSLLGLRRAEIAGMRWSHIDLDDTGILTVTRTVTVSSKGASDRLRTKTKTSKRELPLPKTALRILHDARARARRDRLASGSAWQGEEDGHIYRQVLGEGYHPRTVNARWNAALDNAKLPHIRLHDGRHTAATVLHLDGAPAAVVAAWLGHASPATTMRIYTHSQQRELMKAASQFDSMFGDEEPS
ncbi:tyrosine-type recombinase/integrase [Mycobacteroides chelonae]|uniref:tyrosine-type recombinase/integrase n=1 Tax=Mycobacteroides chelonae TaxID=1774 RepID=UPI001C2C22E3|nr:site-specific integrase [Mycobacteroides chelonae]MBV0918253.1 tyrosine-type recombinase/integrase [Mycobacteroides chelonae]UJW66058.1 site-specific integrase [Mycobacteroides chelonae]